MSKSTVILIVATIITVMLESCDTSGGLESMNDYDQREMLNNLGNNLIVPAYQSLAESTSQLESDAKEFVQNPSSENLSALKNSLKTARINWQYCAPFQFGPAEQVGISAKLNIYPVDQNQIEGNIEAGEYDLGTFSNNDAKGFQAIAYLLYSGSEEEIIGSFASASRSQYLVDITEDIYLASKTVQDSWTSGYLETFISEDALGVDAGSSVAKLVNAMNLNFERNTRDGKVGIPAGFRSLGETIPENTEAYFAGYSVELLEKAMQGYRKIYEGESLSGESGEGLQDYLEAIKAIDTSEESLANKIAGQIAAVFNEIDDLQEPLPNFIDTQTSEMEQVFAEMQQLVVLMKTDMASSLGVIIAYQDNDGD